MADRPRKVSSSLDAHFVDAVRRDAQRRRPLQFLTRMRGSPLSQVFIVSLSLLVTLACWRAILMPSSGAGTPIQNSFSFQTANAGSQPVYRRINLAEISAGAMLDMRTGVAHKMNLTSYVPSTQIFRDAADNSYWLSVPDYLLLNESSSKIGGASAESLYIVNPQLLAAVDVKIRKSLKRLILSGGSAAQAPQLRLISIENDPVANIQRVRVDVSEFRKGLKELVGEAPRLSSLRFNIRTVNARDLGFHTGQLDLSSANLECCAETRSAPFALRERYAMLPQLCPKLPGCLHFKGLAKACHDLVIRTLPAIITLQLWRTASTAGAPDAQVIVSLE